MYSSNYVIQISMMLVVMCAVSNESGVQNASIKNLGISNSNIQTTVSKLVAPGGSSVIPQNETSTKNPPRMGREHVTDKPHLDDSTVPKVLVLSNKSESTSINVANVNSTVEQETSEAPDGVNKITKTLTFDSSNITPLKAIEVSSTANKTVMNSTSILHKINGTVSISTNRTVLSNSTESTSIKPMKPTITEHDDIAVVDEKSEPYSPGIPGIETTFEKKKRKQADYVVPIIAVILSIPLVTIIFTVLYKRSKDWWQHRNYRRMDYLIEGIYQS